MDILKAGFIVSLGLTLAIAIFSASMEGLTALGLGMDTSLGLIVGINAFIWAVIAGIGAAVLSLAESTSAIIDQGRLKELIIKNEKGTIILVDAGENALLIGIVPPRSGIDTALLSLKVAAGHIAKLQIILSHPSPSPDPSSDIFVPDID